MYKVSGVQVIQVIFYWYSFSPYSTVYDYLSSLDSKQSIISKSNKTKNLDLAQPQPKSLKLWGGIQIRPLRYVWFVLGFSSKGRREMAEKYGLLWNLTLLRLLTRVSNSQFFRNRFSSDWSKIQPIYSRNLKT